MLKHPKLSYFHSQAELYNAALLESSPEVLNYVPQPFLFLINGRRYIPDMYIVRGRMRIVQELKPGGVFNEEKRIAMESYLRLHGMQFEVISNESVLNREQEVENWLEIIRVLCTAKDHDTQQLELLILDQLHGNICTQFGEIIDPGDREESFLHELAVFRLLHRGTIQANLVGSPLDYDTEITLCT